MNEQEDSLDQLLKQYETQALPDLVIEPSSWQKTMNAFYDAWIAPVLSWFKSLFEGFNVSNNRYPLPWKTITICVLVGLCIWALYVLIKYFVEKNKQRGFIGERKATLSTKLDLYKAYQQAEKNGDYALASRLFWKWFLHNKKIQWSKTPLEYFGNIQTVKPMYRLMFSNLGAQEELEVFKNSLIKVEHAEK